MDPVWEKLKGDGTSWGKDMSLEYLIRNLSMRQFIQRGVRDVLDGSNAMTLAFNVPETTSEVKSMKLRFELLYYNLPMTVEEVLSTSTTITTSSTTWSGTDLSSAVTDSGGDTVTLKGHIHSGEMPNHGHLVTGELTPTTLPANVTIAINGTDRTAALGGPWNFTGTPFEIDITAYVEKIGRNAIVFGTTQAGRIDAEVIGEIYVP